MISGKQNVVSALKTAITYRYHCKPVHVGSVFVREFLGRSGTVWEGDIELFEFGSRTGRIICYAWLHFEPASTKAVITLQDEIINSPREAVRAIMVSNRKLFGGPSVKVREGLMFLKPNRPLIQFYNHIAGLLGQLAGASIENGEALLRRVRMQIKKLNARIQTNLKTKPSAGLPEKISTDSPLAIGYQDPRNAEFGRNSSI
jgi:hypothetical protein